MLACVRSGCGLVESERESSSSRGGGGGDEPALALHPRAQPVQSTARTAAAHSTDSSSPPLPSPPSPSPLIARPHLSLAAPLAAPRAMAYAAKGPLYPVVNHDPKAVHFRGLTLGTLARPLLLPLSPPHRTPADEWGSIARRTARPVRGRQLCQHHERPLPAPPRRQGPRLARVLVVARSREGPSLLLLLLLRELARRAHADPVHPCRPRSRRRSASPSSTPQRDSASDPPGPSESSSSPLLAATRFSELLLLARHCHALRS